MVEDFAEKAYKEEFPTQTKSAWTKKLIWQKMLHQKIRQTKKNGIMGSLINDHYLPIKFLHSLLDKLTKNATSFVKLVHPLRPVTRLHISVQANGRTVIESKQLVLTVREWNQRLRHKGNRDWWTLTYSWWHRIPLQKITHLHFLLRIDIIL